MPKRIKHNDLLPWFTDDHRDLPPAYLKSCQKFFDSIKSEKNNLMKHWSAVAKASSSKPQASSSKQVTSGPEYDINKSEREKK